MRDELLLRVLEALRTGSEVHLARRSCSVKRSVTVVSATTFAMNRRQIESKPFARPSSLM